MISYIGLHKVKQTKIALYFTTKWWPKSHSKKRKCNTY